MDKQEILEWLYDELKTNFVVTEVPHADAGVYDDLGLDSVDRVELVIRIEDKFGVEFPEGMANMTLGEVADKILELSTSK